MNEKYMGPLLSTDVNARDTHMRSYPLLAAYSFLAVLFFPGFGHAAPGVDSLQSVDLMNVPVLVSADCCEVDWSPDGSRLVASRDTSDKIWTMLPDGTSPVKITELSVSKAWSPVYRPNGTQIYYLDNVDSYHWVIAAEAMGGGVRSKIMMVPGGDGYTSLSFAPDGSQLAFLYLKRWSYGTLQTANANGSGIATVVTDSTLRSVSWGRGISSNKFAVAKLINGYSTVSVMNKDGSGLVRVTPAELGECSSPNWGPNGDHLAFSRKATGETNGQIWVINVDGSGARSVVADGYDNTLPKISPDGKRVAYISKRNGKWSLCMVQLATPTLNTSLVTFDACGGVVSPASATVTNGLAYGALPVPVRAGFAFAGWYTVAGAAGELLTEDSPVTATVAHTLYAAWQGGAYTVTFDPEAGTVGQPSKTVTNGLAYGTLPVPLLEHYTFEGWWTGEGGTGALVTAGTTVSNASDHALHAKWAGVASTVTFSAQGGTVDPALKVVNFGSAYGVLPSPVWTGSLFGGWWTEAGGVGAQVSSGTVVAAAANHTLYAKWTANEAVDWQASLGAAFGLALSDAFTGPAKVTVTGLPAGLTYNTATRTIEGSPSKLGTFTVTVAMEGAETKTFAIDVKPLPAWAQGSFSGHVEGGGLATMSVAASGKITGKIVVPGASYSFSAKSYASGDEEGGFAVLADVKAGATVLKLELLVTGEGQPETPGVASGTLDGETGLTLWRDVWKESAAATLLPLGYYTATLPGGGDCGSGYLTFTVDKTGKFKTAGKLADGTAVSLSGTLALDGSGRLIAVLYTAPGGYGGGCFFGLVEFVRPAGGGAVFLRPLDGSELRWESLNPQATESYGDGFARTLRLVGGLYDKLASLQTYYSGGLSVGVSWTPPALPIKRKVTDYNWDYPMPETDSEVERLPPKITSSEPDMAPDAGVSPGGLELTVNDAGTAISAPKSPAPSKMLDEETRQFFGEYNYGELVNPSGLTFTFAKATGLFKGAFNVYYDYVSAVDATKEENGETFAHVVKKVSFEGALTPVRGDTSDGVGGRGFFLWAAKGAYDTGKVDRDDNPVMKEYPLNLSYDFKLQ